MKYEEIIKKSIKKLNQDFEVRNSLFLNIVHRNIDILIKHSSEWFGEHPPKEFVDVLNSLVNFSVLISEQIKSISELINEKAYQKFYPYKILKSLRYDFIELVTFKKMNISGNKAIEISTSKEVFKDSLYHIFFSISQFITEESEANVKLSEEGSSVLLSLSFINLSENLPDIRTLLRLFFTDNHADIGSEVDYGLKIGLNIAVENIRRIGGIIHIDNLSDYHKLHMVISFPTIAFLETIKDVRKYEIPETKQKKEGIILVSFTDKITELLLSESITKNGYSVTIDSLTRFNLLENYDEVTHIVVDYESISTVFPEVTDFYKQHKSKILLVVHRKSVDPVSYPNVTYLSIPLEIDKILEKLE
ncbi:MAG: hypothetical protein PF637_11915 [Spirochaetes bacterium]|nr:hypothetical protein [Spirochaetota bacterium]